MLQKMSDAEDILRQKMSKQLGDAKCKNNENRFKNIESSRNKAFISDSGPIFGASWFTIYATIFFYLSPRREIVVQIELISKFLFNCAFNLTPKQRPN